MPYKNKTYVAFDADEDMRYFNIMKAWKQNDNIDFNFHDAHEIKSNPNLTNEENIKRALRERFQNSKIFIILVGEKTKNLYKFVRWEIEMALKEGLPIIVVNLNGKRSLCEERCPPIIKEELAMHVSFKKDIIAYSLENWEEVHYAKKQQNKKMAYWYKEEVYQKLGLQ
jgi:hypothetical protein